MKQLFEGLSGPFIEVAGPTRDGYALVDIGKLNRKIFISNIYPGAPLLQSRGICGYRGRVDFIARADNLPFPDNFLGAIFCSRLSPVVTEAEIGRRDAIGHKAYYDLMKRETAVLRQRAVKEAWRALIPGGCLVWQRGRSEDIAYAEETGFSIVAEMVRPRSSDCILRKTEK